jgi:hypothetical protein
VIIILHVMFLLPCSIIKSMKVVRNHVVIKRMNQQDDSFVDASPGQRVAFVWELTAELWSLRDSRNVKQRLQRNVTNLIKKQG